MKLKKIIIILMIFLTIIHGENQLYQMIGMEIDYDEIPIKTPILNIEFF